MMLLAFILWCIAGFTVTSASGTVVLSAGTNRTLHCQSGSRASTHQRHREIYWQWSGRQIPGEHFVSDDGSLQLHNVVANTSGTYICHRSKDDSVIVKYTLLVPGPPSSPSNLSVSEVDGVIVLRWHNTYTQEYLDAAPDTTLRLRYRQIVHPVVLHHDSDRHAIFDENQFAEDNEQTSAGEDMVQAEESSPAGRWFQLKQHLLPGQTWTAIQHLIPSASYQFEVWAENKYGPSPPATVTITTRDHSPAALTRTGAWQRSRTFLVCVVSVLAACNIVALLVWIRFLNAATKNRRRRHIANHSGLSGECEQLELVCHAHEPPMETSLTLPHHAALV